MVKLDKLQHCISFWLQFDSKKQKIMHGKVEIILFAVAMCVCGCSKWCLCVINMQTYMDVELNPHITQNPLHSAPINFSLCYCYCRQLNFRLTSLKSFFMCCSCERRITATTMRFFIVIFSFRIRQGRHANSLIAVDNATKSIVFHSCVFSNLIYCWDCAAPASTSMITM